MTELPSHQDDKGWLYLELYTKQILNYIVTKQNSKNSFQSSVKKSKPFKSTSKVLF